MALATIGSRLRYLRQKRGWTIKDVARYAQIPPATLTDWERDVSVPPADKLAELAKLYGVTMDFIVTGSQANENLKRKWSPAFAVLSRAYQRLTDDKRDAFVQALSWLYRNRDKIEEIVEKLPALPLSEAGSDNNQADEADENDEKGEKDDDFEDL